MSLTAQRNGTPAPVARKRRPNIIWTEAERKTILDEAMRLRSRNPSINITTAFKAGMEKLPESRHRLVASVREKQPDGKLKNAWFVEAWDRKPEGQPSVIEALMPMIRRQDPPAPPAVDSTPEASDLPEVADEEGGDEFVPEHLLDLDPQILLNALEAQLRGKIECLRTLMDEMETMFARLGMEAFPGAAFRGFAPTATGRGRREALTPESSKV